MQEKSRFLKGADGTIYDSLTSLTWTAEDSRLALEKDISWEEANTWAEELNKKKFGGHGDWRLPTIQEALSLFDAKKLNKDFKNGDIHIDPIFPAGAGNCTWTSQTRGQREAQIVFYVNGCPYWYEKDDKTISHAARLARRG
ncbi:MAG: DUF1566 domain-containing protein [Nitrospinae bacterium]|nr:DUF1566 domain-containing protein [Nitrospinota bacterium]